MKDINDIEWTTDDDQVCCDGERLTATVRINGGLVDLIAIMVDDTDEDDDNSHTATNPDLDELLDAARLIAGSNRLTVTIIDGYEYVIVAASTAAP